MRKIKRTVRMEARTRGRTRGWAASRLIRSRRGRVLGQRRSIGGRYEKERVTGLIKGYRGVIEGLKRGYRGVIKGL